MATLQSAINFARAQAQTDSNGLTDANAIIFANEALLDSRGRLIAAGIDAAQVQESSSPMESGTGTYLYPDNLWWLKAIELNYANNVGQDYIRARQVDIANLPNNESFGWLRTNAATAAPYFDDRGDWFVIFPTPVADNSAGIKIFYFLEPTEYTSTSDSISYPESLDYRMLGFRIAAGYKRSLADFNSAASFDAEYEKKLSKLIATLGRGSQQPIQAVTTQWSGFEF
jgi:hypothetical protein